jgi:hypothetical protein
MFQLIRKDSGKGVIYAVDRGRVFVASLADGAAAPKKSCGPRAGCGSCGGCATLPDGYADKFHVPVADAGSFKVGGSVRYCRYVLEPSVVSVLVFGVPVALAITTMVLWLLNAPERAESLTAVLTIAASFFCGVVILALLDGLFKRRYPSTIIDAGEGRDASG